MTQKEAVKKHLLSGKSLTSVEAFELFGCTRLAVVISSLRKDGFDIRTLMMEGKNRFGGHCNYAKYVLYNNTANNVDNL